MATEPNLLKQIYFSILNAKEGLYHQISSDEIELLVDTKLFDNLDETAFRELASSISLEHYPAGKLIFAQGSHGDSLYIIKEGSVRVFTYTGKNEKIPLARLNKGDYFGEQALLGEGHKTRNANIEAITDTVLIRIQKDIISKVFHVDKELEARLAKIGEDQILSNLASCQDIYQNIATRLQQKSEHKIIHVPKDEIIFKEGEQAEHVYLIVSGKVRIEIPSQPDPLTIQIKNQQIFGEVGVLNGSPRSGTAIAAEDTTLLRIEAQEFKEIYADTPQLQQLLKTLSNTYTLPSRGMVQQYTGKTMGMTAITTIYELADGRKVIATNAVEGHYFVMEQQPLPQPIEKYMFERGENQKIEISAAGNAIVAIKCSGQWEDLSKACKALLDGKNVLPHALKAFSQTGQFDLKAIAPLTIPDTVCDCMMVKKESIETLISSGVCSLAQISQKTGACSVCGSCRARILSMLGQQVWMSAIMSKATTHNDHVVSFQLQPVLGKFEKPLPGQHVVIQVRIGEVWVERAYTLTDLPKDGNLTITIKKENSGFFTQWIFNTFTKSIPIYVCQPQGHFVLNMDGKDPVLCFAGGIGITPFVTFAKALQSSKDDRALKIVYIAPSKKDFVFVEEFKEIEKQHPHVSTIFWDKETQGRISEEHILELINQLDQPDIYICGPEGWEEFLVETLKKIQYNPEKLFVEKFTYANPIIP